MKKKKGEKKKVKTKILKRTDNKHKQQSGLEVILSRLFIVQKAVEHKKATE